MCTEQTISELAEDLQQTAEHSWYRFCLGHIEAPMLWPCRIKMTKTVFSYEDMPQETLAILVAEEEGRLIARRMEEYPATSNRLGAVCAVLGDQLLGVKPAEFEIVTWQSERPASERGPSGIKESAPSAPTP